MLPDGRLETDFRNDVVLAVGRTGRAEVWSQNAGKVVVGEAKRKRAVKLGDEGMSDIIGITSAGRFVAFEVKSPTRPTTLAQRAFLAFVRKMRGVAAFYRYDPHLDWDANVTAAVETLLKEIYA